MSEELKRYQFISGNDSTKWRCVPHGKWVLYDDVKSLAASHARLVKALASGLPILDSLDIYSVYVPVRDLMRAALADAKKVQP